MVAQCSGGASGVPKSLSPGVVYLSGQGLEQLLVAALGLSEPWAALIVFAAGMSFDLNTFCNENLPAMPTFTTADIIDISTSNFIANPTAFQKLSDLISIGVWYGLCQCSAPGTSTPPAAPAFPGGIPIVNPPGFGGTVAGPCFDRKDLVILPAQFGGTFHAYDLGPNFLPQTTFENKTGDIFTAFTERHYRIPPGATSIAFNLTPLQTNAHCYFRWDVWNAADTGILLAYDTLINLDSGATPLTGTVTNLPVGSTFWSFVLGDGFPNQPNQEEYTLEVYFNCSNGNSGNVVTPCCPPDPTLQARLDQIYSLVTLIQRQISPFAYVPGTVSTGLSGSGELSIQGLLGVKISPTSFPASFGEKFGDPDSLWLDSWIRWGNADGWTQREFLTAAPFVSLPSLAGQYTKLGYTFATGLVADVTQLKREP